MPIPVANFAMMPGGTGSPTPPSGTATGQSGSFASKLEVATSQQNRPTETTASPANGAKRQTNPAGNHGRTDDLSEAALEAILNGATGGAATQQQPALLAALLSGLQQQGAAEGAATESAVSRMLHQLAGSAVTASPIPATAADISMPANHPVLTGSFPGETDLARNLTAHSALKDGGHHQHKLTAEQLLGLGSRPADATNPPPPPATKPTALETVTVQSASGQTFTVTQGTAVLEEAPAEESKSGSAVPAESQRLDINGNYIRSRLPNKPEDNPRQESGGRFQEALNQPRYQKTTVSGNQTNPIQTTFEQQTAHAQQPVFGQETQPLVFSLPQNSPQPLAASSPLAPSAAYHLPSGLVVPEGTVADQVIAHFAVNRRLETGTVNLKLHPQELGELRMEIKVEQDNIKAHIITQSPQAQEMIDRHLPRLRETLAQQGLHLQQVEVTVAAHDHTGREHFQDNRAWQQGKPAPQRAGAEQPVFALEPEEADGGSRNAATSLSVHA